MTMMRRNAPRYCVECRRMKPATGFPPSGPRCTECLASTRDCPGCGKTKPIGQFGAIHEGEMPRCDTCRNPPPPPPSEPLDRPAANCRHAAARERVEDRPNLSAVQWLDLHRVPSPKAAAVRRAILEVLDVEKAKTLGDIHREINWWTIETISEALEELTFAFAAEYAGASAYRRSHAAQG